MRLLYGSILVAFLLRSGCILFSVRFWSACLLFGCLSILMFHSAAECPLAVRMLPNLWCLLRFRSGHFSSAFRNTLRLSSSRPVMPFWLPFGCSPVFSCWSPVSGFNPVACGLSSGCVSLFRPFVVTSRLGFGASAHPSPSSCHRIVFWMLCGHLSFAFRVVIQQANSRSSSVSRNSLHSAHLPLALRLPTDCLRIPCSEFRCGSFPGSLSFPSVCLPMDF